MRKRLQHLARCAVFVALLLPGIRHAHADVLSGNRGIWLSSPDGDRVRIASVQFQPMRDGRVRFALHLDGEGFEEDFLAMRPVQCLTGLREQPCYFP